MNRLEETCSLPVMCENQQNNYSYSERLTELERLARQYGSPNCWTGTTGTLAAAILELIRHIRDHHEHRRPINNDGTEEAGSNH